MCFNREITPSIPHLTVADKQGIRLKMHEMAILKTLIFQNYLGGACPKNPPPPLVQTQMTSIWGSQTWGLLSMPSDLDIYISPLSGLAKINHRSPPLQEIIVNIPFRYPRPF